MNVWSREKSQAMTNKIKTKRVIGVIQFHLWFNFITLLSFDFNSTESFTNSTITHNPILTLISHNRYVNVIVWRHYPYSWSCLFALSLLVSANLMLLVYKTPSFSDPSGVYLSTPFASVRVCRNGRLMCKRRIENRQVEVVTSSSK